VLRTVQVMRYTPKNILQSMRLWRAVGGEDRRLRWGYKPRAICGHAFGWLGYTVGYLTPGARGSRGSFSEVR